MSSAVFSTLSLSYVNEVSMCIAAVVLNYSERFPLIIAHNREEDTARRTGPVAVRDDILSALDLKAGGVAAVGLNVRTGTFAVLTNCRINGSFHTDGESRGALIRQVLSEGVSESIARDIRCKTYQGDFHLFTGSAFVNDTITLTYLTNIKGENSRELTSSQLEVIVRMNEHPSSLHDWSSKIEFLRSLIRNELIRNPDMGSADAVLEVITRCMSITGPIPEPQSPIPPTYPWSPVPGMEPTVLRRIIVPAISIDEHVRFGTVAQTVIVVDRGHRQVHFNYRSVLQDCPSVSFAPWEHHLVSYPDTN